MSQVYKNRWETISTLDEGGQAHAFIVKDLNDTSGETQAVLKRLKNLQRVDRFRREIQIISSLEHKGIISILDSDLEGKKPFYVSPYYKGGTLHDYVLKEKPSIEESIDLIIDIGSALYYAHQKEVIHRDIKPSNIFISNKLPLIGDWGLGFLPDSEERLTMTNEAVGPRNYMAPELEDGRFDKITTACDVYSLGKLIYFCISGGRIFARERYREKDWDLVKKIINKETGDNNYLIEHINRLLDHMIIIDPINRAKLFDVLSSLRRIKRLIQTHKNVPGKNIPQTCNYCGWGTYQDAININGGAASIHNFGLAPVGSMKLKALVCDQCGHVELFRLDLTRVDNWWEADQNKTRRD